MNNAHENTIVHDLCAGSLPVVMLVHPWLLRPPRPSRTAFTDPAEHRQEANKNAPMRLDDQSVITQEDISNAASAKQQTSFRPYRTHRL